MCSAVCVESYPSVPVIHKVGWGDITAGLGSAGSSGGTPGKFCYSKQLQHCGWLLTTPLTTGLAACTQWGFNQAYHQRICPALHSALWEIYANHWWGSVPCPAPFQAPWCCGLHRQALMALLLSQLYPVVDDLSRLGLYPVSHFTSRCLWA